MSGRELLSNERLHGAQVMLVSRRPCHSATSAGEQEFLAIIIERGPHQQRFGYLPSLTSNLEHQRISYTTRSMNA